MLLAQQTEVLLLDEATTFLDIAHQYNLLGLGENLRRAGGTTVAAVLHDVNQGCRYTSHLVVEEGRVVAAKAPAEVMTKELVHDVYDLSCSVIANPHTGTPPGGSRRGRRIHPAMAKPKGAWLRFLV